VGRVECTILPAQPEDAVAIATLHVESWRSAYRGLLPDAFLDGPVVENRLILWRERLNGPAADRRLVLKAILRGELVGFACVLLDDEPAHGPRLDNLHVRPPLKGGGIGSLLFHSALDWVGRTAPGQPMHLWVIEGNVPARRFYDRHGGVVAERRTLEVVPGIPVPELRYVWPPAPQ
jgi:GNAT superfamily N-acetyltransferase